MVRKEHAEALILVAGFNWAYDLTPLKEDPIDAEGIAYVSHPYPEKRKAPWEEKWESTGALHRREGNLLGGLVL